MSRGTAGLRLKRIIGAVIIILIIAILSYTYYTPPEETQPVATIPRGRISIDVEIPSTTYSIGDQVLISGIVKIDGMPFKSMYVHLYITDSGNNTIWVKQLKTDSNGVFKYSYYIDSSHKEGEYTLYAIAMFVERKFDYVKFTIHR